MVSKVQFREVSWKLDNLRKDRSSLYTALDGYFDNVLTAGQLWVQSRGSAKQTHQEICSILDQAMFYVEERLDELSASPSKELSDETESASSLADAAHSSATTSTLPQPQPASSLFATKSSRTSTDQPLLKLQERMDALGCKTSTKSELTDAIAEVKSGMEDTKKRVEKCEGRIDGLLERFNTFTKEYTTNRSKDDTRLKKCEERMNALDQDTNQLTSDVSKVKRKVNIYDDSFGEVNRKMINIHAKFVEMEKEKNTTITMIRGIEEGLETCQAKLGNVDILDDKIRQIEDERERDRSRMKDAEERLDKLEEDRMDLEIQRLGILEDRLLVVEEERQNDIKHIGDVKEHLKTLSTQIQAVEKKQEEQHQSIGFTAYTWDTITTKHGNIIGFDKILSNKGGHYNATSGKFTAPVNGTYLAAFCLRQCGEGVRQVNFVHERVSTGQGSLEITATWTSSCYANSSNVIILDMKKGDKLFLRSLIGGVITFPCAFSCALLG